MSAIYNFEIDQGETFLEAYQWLKDDGSPVAVANYTAKLDIKESIDSTTALLSLTSGGASPDITLDSSNGFIEVLITSAVTAGLDFIVGVYDLMMLNNTTGDVVMLLQGNVALNKRVTQLAGSDTIMPFGQDTAIASGSISINDALYIFDDGGVTKCARAKADVLATAQVSGFAVEGGIDGDTITIISIGFVSDDSHAFASPYGQVLYLSKDTAGLVTTTFPGLGNVLKIVGWTRSDTKWLIAIQEAEQL